MIQRRALRALVQQAPLKQILREWSRQIKRSENPVIFANMYLEYLRDPGNYEIRAACSMFISFTRSRSWQQLLVVIGSKLDKDVLEIFKLPDAADFYEAWKAMIVEQIRAYWEEFIMAHKETTLPGPKDWSPIGKYKLK